MALLHSRRRRRMAVTNLIVAVALLAAGRWLPSATGKSTLLATDRDSGVDDDEYDHSFRLRARNGHGNNNKHDDDYAADPHGSFWQWCHSQAGVEVHPDVDIGFFEYYDYMKALAEGSGEFCTEALWIEDDDDDDYTNDIARQGSNHSSLVALLQHQQEEFSLDAPCRIPVETYPSVQVRGLKAVRAIPNGATLMRIPYSSLWTISNAIDSHQILSKVIGEEARIRFGWQEELDSYYEQPLLALALLYHLDDLRDGHRSQGKGRHTSELESSSFWPAYWLKLASSSLNSRDNNMEHLPILWNATRLRQTAPPAVQHIVHGIQSDVRHMYVNVVQTVVLEYPKLFGPKDGEKEGKWMFSFENFEWACAIVNSRHWKIPIPGNTDEASKILDLANSKTEENDEAEEEEGTVLDSPPASLPTEEWMAHQQRQREIEDGGGQDGSNPVVDRRLRRQSFLAPIADLLNFGPPCTRGFYNASSQTFDIVSICPFRQGQEITFWYSDHACEEEIIANYGFANPSYRIPNCPSPHYPSGSSITESHRNQELEQEIQNLFEDLDTLDVEVERLQMKMRDCGCDDDGDAPNEPPAAAMPRASDALPSPLDFPSKQLPVSEQSKSQQQRRMPSPKKRPRSPRDEHTGIRGGDGHLSAPTTSKSPVSRPVLGEEDKLSRGKARRSESNRRNSEM